MASLKIGSSTPQPTTLRPTVERPVAALRTEPPSTQALGSRDEFVTGGSAQRLPPQTGGTAGAQRPPGTTQLTLPSALEPFREGLDKIADQLTPDMLGKPFKLVSFLLGSVKELGLKGRDMLAALNYVLTRGPVAQSSGKDRLV
jgi:hypothetical protein